jgi:outer membrane protein OmpA-like peptidoglycan-associated protein
MSAWQAKWRELGGLYVCLLLVTASSAEALQPWQPGVTIVLSVSNATTIAGDKAIADVAQGDYETLVTITDVSEARFALTAFIDALDAQGVRRQVSIARQVLARDTVAAREQILGFSTDDPAVVSGTTTLGPSLSMIRELQSKGHFEYSFRNFVRQPLIKGTLFRADPVRVSFPVLINGKRVELTALRVTGQMASGGATRPYEQLILEHAQQPLSLRVAYGPRGGSMPFKADFAREVVRIDFPTAREKSLSEALTRECRAVLPGIYFDFNEATIKPQSRPTLGAVAALLGKQPKWRVVIEGHTDNVGGDRYNDELSKRRAAAVKAALQAEFGIDTRNVTTAGFGARQPIESNETLSGRARNRRVELVRDCG